MTPRETLEELAGLDRLAKRAMKRRRCGWCEAPIIGGSCYAMYAKKCTPQEMEDRLRRALREYKPRARARQVQGGEVG